MTNLACSYEDATSFFDTNYPFDHSIYNPSTPLDIFYESKRHHHEPLGAKSLDTIFPFTDEEASMALNDILLSTSPLNPFTNGFVGSAIKKEDFSADRNNVFFPDYTSHQYLSHDGDEITTINNFLNTNNYNDRNDNVIINNSQLKNKDSTNVNDSKITENSENKQFSNPSSTNYATSSPTLIKKESFYESARLNHDNFLSSSIMSIVSDGFLADRIDTDSLVHISSAISIMDTNISVLPEKTPEKKLGNNENISEPIKHNKTPILAEQLDDNVGENSSDSILPADLTINLSKCDSAFDISQLLMHFDDNASFHNHHQKDEDIVSLQLDLENYLSSSTHDIYTSCNNSIKSVITDNKSDSRDLTTEVEAVKTSIQNRMPCFSPSSNLQALHINDHDYCAANINGDPEQNSCNINTLTDVNSFNTFGSKIKANVQNFTRNFPHFITSFHNNTTNECIPEHINSSILASNSNSAKNDKFGKHNNKNVMIGSFFGKNLVSLLSRNNTHLPPKSENKDAKTKCKPKGNRPIKMANKLPQSTDGDNTTNKNDIDSKRNQSNLAHENTNNNTTANNNNNNNRKRQISSSHSISERYSFVPSHGIRDNEFVTTQQNGNGQVGDKTCPSSNNFFSNFSSLLTFTSSATSRKMIMKEAQIIESFLSNERKHLSNDTSSDQEIFTTISDGQGHVYVFDANGNNATDSYNYTSTAYYQNQYVANTAYCNNNNNSNNIKSNHNSKSNHTKKSASAKQPPNNALNDVHRVVKKELPLQNNIRRVSSPMINASSFQLKDNQSFNTIIQTSSIKNQSFQSIPSTMCNIVKSEFTNEFNGNFAQQNNKTLHKNKDINENQNVPKSIYNSNIVANENRSFVKSMSPWTDITMDELIYKPDVKPTMSIVKSKQTLSGALPKPIDNAKIENNAESDSVNPRHTIKLGPIEPHASENELKNMFKRFGPIQIVKREKEYALITYMNDRDANTALRRGKHINGLSNKLSICLLSDANSADCPNLPCQSTQLLISDKNNGKPSKEEYDEIKSSSITSIHHPSTLDDKKNISKITNKIDTIVSEPPILYTPSIRSSPRKLQYQLKQSIFRDENVGTSNNNTGQNCNKTAKKLISNDAKKTVEKPSINKLANNVNSTIQHSRFTRRHFTNRHPGSRKP